MEPILTAVIPVVIIGIICAAVLVIASKLMAVKEDKRFFEIRECLPGANCGACGYAGCDGYAKALCENGDVKMRMYRLIFPAPAPFPKRTGKGGDLTGRNKAYFRAASSSTFLTSEKFSGKCDISFVYPP